MHDAAIGRWWQVDPKAEYLYGMSPYNSMANNPILYNDPNGDVIPQLVGGIVGGFVNLADQALKGNVTSFGEGLAYFGTGAAAGVAVSMGQLGAARAITVVGNKAVQTVTGKFDPTGIDSWGDVAGLALDVGTDMLSPGLTSALSKPLTKALTARVGANLAKNGAGAFGSTVSGSGNTFISAIDDIGFSVGFTDEFVVSASRLGGGNLGVNIAGGATKALTNFYPKNGGALGKWGREFLMPGTKIDRYGSGFGRYLSPTGTPLNMRALPPGNLGTYNSFKVLKPFEVQSSIISPAFGKIGLGKQYLSPVNVNTLLKRGIITPW